MTPSDTREDHALLAAVAGGDEQALRILYDRHAPWLSLRLARRCADEEVVADVLSETFVAIWRGARRFRGESEVAGWIWGIAAKRLVSRLRGRPVPEPWSAEDLSRELPPLASAEDQVLLGVQHGDLGQALTALSPQLRAVVQATILDGLSTREAAKLLGLPQGTVKGRLRKAKAELRAALVDADGHRDRRTA